MTNKTLGELLIGRKVRATIDCRDTKAGEMYKVAVDSVGYVFLEGTSCFCVYNWIPLDFEIKPKTHKHDFKCADCEVKK